MALDDDNDKIVFYSSQMWFPLFINLLMSIGAYFATVKIIPSIKDTFIKANLFGIDMSKTTSEKV